jgi:hypothetical protein
MMNEKIQIGLLLRSGTTAAWGLPGEPAGSAGLWRHGARSPAGRGGRRRLWVIYDIHIDDDGLVRQLVTAREISEEGA